LAFGKVTGKSIASCFLMDSTINQQTDASNGRVNIQSAHALLLLPPQLFYGSQDIVRD